MAPRRKTSVEVKTAKAKPGTLARPKKLIGPIEAAKPKKSSNAIWVGKVFVIGGDLGPQNPHANVQSWILHHGGRVDKLVSTETTNLICSPDDFKNKIASVREAWKLGSVRCKIIHVDYLYECLRGKKPRRVNENQYRHDKLLAKQRKDEKCQAAGKLLNKDGYIKDIESSNELADPKLHRLYYDSTFFEYKIILTRATTNANGKIVPEKWTIFLFESRAKPSTYKVGGKYKKGNTPVVLWRDECIDKDFDVAFEDFRVFFKSRTGIDWDQRLDKLKPEEYRFVYMPPTGGKPLGVVPHGWKEPISKIEQELDISMGTEEVDGEEDYIMGDPDLRDDTDSDVENQ